MLSQVQLLPRIPINTISFNCADREANVFLCQLAKETGGRFHYYSEDGMNVDGPEPWEVCNLFLFKDLLRAVSRAFVIMITATVTQLKFPV